MALPTKTDLESLSYAYLRSGAFFGTVSKSSIDLTNLDYAYLRNGAKIGNPATAPAVTIKSYGFVFG